MKKKTKNIDLRYAKSRDFTQKDFMYLFNCPKCGFHAKAIAKIWVKGFEDEYIIQTQTIHPEKEKIVKNISDNKLSNDGEIIEELICGKCSGPGGLSPVPYEILELYGYDVKKTIPKKPKTSKLEIIKKFITKK